MSKIWEHNGLYTFLLPYVKAAIRISFRRFRVTGIDPGGSDPRGSSAPRSIASLPADAPVIYVSNHCATLTDALVILYASPRTVGFGARADIFRKPRAAAILRWLRILPVARMRDGREAVASNVAVLAEATECIAHGVAFCLFPEGTHYPDAEVHPFKKGATRLAVESARTLGRTVYIIPVGLQYSDLYRYMSDVRVSFGAPMAVTGSENPTELASAAHDAVVELASGDDPRGSDPRGSSRPFRLLVAAICALICGIVASPLLIAEALLIRKLKDKAWSNTIRFCVSLFFWPLWPFHSLFYLAVNALKR